MSETPACVAGLRQAVLGLAIATCACGCGNGGAEPRLPLFFRLDASATTQQSGFDVDCELHFIVEVAGVVSRTDAVVEYIGTMGGEARRALLRPDGSGVAFSADAHYPRLQVLHLLPDRVQLVSLDFPPGSPPTGSRFWDELNFFEGRLRADGRIEGAWTCAPLDTEQGGVVDDMIFAEGAWSTAELSR